MRRLMSLTAFLALGACTGEEEPVSKITDATAVFDIPPPAVDSGWPCPPFDQSTTQDQLEDGDGDAFANCQEENLGLDPTKRDSDGDGIDDYTEVGDGGLLDPEDTDRDGTIDALDDDDDGDTIPSADEVGAPDHDGDGIPSYLDGDDDNDEINGSFEDVNGNGDLDDDDADADGTPNWLDDDDDGDTAPSIAEHFGDDPNADDTDDDGTPNWLDTDDDGDGIATIDEDFNGSGDPSDDDYDLDRFPDFNDVDEDGDGVLTVDEDLDGDVDYAEHDSDGDGSPDYRDDDDDNDGVIGDDELPEPAEGEDDPVLLTEDTDGDGRPNYRDADDDGDGCPTADEDPDDDGDPTSDDTNGDGTSDFLDAADVSCATPSPEPAATWTLSVELEGAPLAVRGSDVIVTVTGPGDDLRATGALSGAAGTIEVPGLETDGAYQVNVTLDLHGNLVADPADGVCNPGTDEETEWSFRVPADARNFDFDVTVDLGGSSQPAACAANQ